MFPLFQVTVLVATSDTPLVNAGSPVHPLSVCVVELPLIEAQTSFTGFVLAEAMLPGSTTANEADPARSAQVNSRRGRCRRINFPLWIQ